MTKTQKFVVEAADNIRFMNSLIAQMNDLKKEMQRINLFLDKYLPLDKNIQTETTVRRIV